MGVLVAIEALSSSIESATSDWRLREREGVSEKKNLQVFYFFKYQLVAGSVYCQSPMGWSKGSRQASYLTVNSKFKGAT